MIIMQTVDALARESYIESNGLAKIIFRHELKDSVCVQYHPKGLKGIAYLQCTKPQTDVDKTCRIGGVISELDSHHITPSNPDPLCARFSPWHACGPTSTHPTYSAGMKRHADLHFLGAALRLKPGEEDIQGAAKQWEDVLGVRAQGAEVVFTNARMGFVEGVEGEAEGITEIRIGVEGKEMLKGIFQRAREEALKVDERQGAVDMLGVTFLFIDIGVGAKSRL